MAAGMIHIGLFDGIGGFGMAAAWCGIETVVSCEIGAFGSDVLASLFPAAYHHKDIRTLTKTIIDERLIPRFGADYGRRTILTGGFPCQPFSSTGKRRGAADDRYLWPEMLRIIGDVRPRWVIGENVAGILSGWYNPLTSLRWKASPICSERVTSFKRNAGNTPSTGSAKTLKPSDIPSGRWLFRLVPSGHPTGATECGSWPPMPVRTVMIDGQPIDLPPRLLPTPMANIKGAGLNVNSKKLAAKKGASYLENVVAGVVVRAGVSGIFRMNHRFALTMMGYAPNHCAAGYERILRTVCLMMKSKKLSTAPINDSTKKP